MNHPRPLPIARHPLYQQSLRNLNQALKDNCHHSYRERIEIFGRHHFGHLWAPREIDPETGQYVNEPSNE